jgi:carboxypeptidase D
MARGYMSNAELEIAVHAFGSRCSNVSRIYRYLMYNTSL